VDKRLLQAFGLRNDPLGQIVRQRRICPRHDFGATPLAMTVVCESFSEVFLSLKIGDFSEASSHKIKFGF
jgi:hypothetical protein